MNLYNDAEILEAAIKALVTPAEREKSAKTIKTHVEIAARELSLENFGKFENELYQQIFSLVRSDAVCDIQGGIHAIQELIDCSSAATESKVIKFANTLSKALKVNTNFSVLEFVAEALGCMARHAPAAHDDYVDFELNRALEWLRSTVPHCRFAACAVLHQLAENAPTLFFVRSRDFFDYIWGPLRDVKDSIRICAAKALSASLVVMKYRQQRLEWYCHIYEQILVGFQKNTQESVHGSLLVIGEMIKHSDQFMVPRYTETCKAVLALKDHKSIVVRASLIQIIPNLAEYCPDSFVRSYLDDSLDTLIKCMKSSELRSHALLSIGKLCRSMGSHLSYRIDELVVIVRDALQSNNKKFKDIPPEALLCVSDMVYGLGVSFHFRVLDLLDAMLQSGLTQELIEALSVIALNMPMHKDIVHRRLLEEIKNVLAGKNMSTTPPPPSGKTKDVVHGNLWIPAYRSLYGRRGFATQTTAAATVTITSDMVNVIVRRDAELVLLALRTLKTLASSSKEIVSLVQTYVVPFLRAGDMHIREEACTTISKLLSTVLKNIPLRSPTSAAVQKILVNLLEAAVTDSELCVRLNVLRCLSKNYDVFLCQSRFVDILMFLLSDSHFVIRVEAVSLLGQVAFLNPSAVLPHMRYILKQFITELHSSIDQRQKEDILLILCTYLRSFSLQRVITPFVESLITALPLTSDVRLTTAALEALGELCLVIKSGILPHSSHLIPLIIANMVDRSAIRKQETAVKTLGCLVSASGLVVSPYLRYPKLLPCTLDLLGKASSNTPWSLRCEVLRSLGLLGALDPRKYELIVTYNAEHQVADADYAAVTTVENVNANIPSHYVMYDMSVMKAVASPANADAVQVSPTSDNYYPQIALTALMKILKDATLNVHHTAVTQAIMFIFKCLGIGCVHFLGQIIPYFLQLVPKCGAGLRESLLHQLSQLASIVKYHLAPYLPKLFDIIIEYWTVHVEHILNIVESIATHVSDELVAYVPKIIDLLLSSLSVAKSEVMGRSQDERPMSASRSPFKPLERVLSCVDALRATLRPFLHLIAPQLCRLIAQLVDIGNMSHKILLTTLRTMHRLITSHALVECSNLTGRIVHCVLNCMQDSKTAFDKPESIYMECVSIISCIARQLKRQFLIFDSTVRLTINSCNANGRQYFSVIQSIQGDRIRHFSTGSDDALLQELADEIEDVESAFLKSTLDLHDDINKDITEPHFGILYSALATSGGLGASVKLPLNEQQLQKSWDVLQRSTSADWNEWFRRLSIELLRESPSPALRACWALAQSYAPLARELFNAAFVSCWCELNETYKDNLVQSLYIAFHSSSIPPEILQVLLNLVEFMEHDVEALPIDPATLAEIAHKSHAYAKALHYRELEFQSNPTGCFESLININKKLEQYDAAAGVLRMVQNMQVDRPELGISVEESWLAKLGRWREALDFYDERLKSNPGSVNALLGKIKCLYEIGHWDKVMELCMSHIEFIEASVDPLKDVHHIKAAVIGARAAWSLNEWSTMDSFVSRLSQDNIDASFMRAVIAANSEDYNKARIYIDRTRRMLDESLTALLGESYNRAYVSFIMTQQLSELEEIIDYKALLATAGVKASVADSSLDDLVDVQVISRQNSLSSAGNWQVDSDDNSMKKALYAEAMHRKSFLMDTWRRRIKGCLSSGQAAISHWQRILNVRRSILGYREDVDTWLDFVMLCRHGGNIELAERLISVIRDDLQEPISLSRSNSELFGNRVAYIAADSPMLPAQNDMNATLVTDFRIQFEILRQQWARGNYSYAVSELSGLVNNISAMSSNHTSQELSKVHVECILKLGAWKINMIPPGTPIDLNTRIDVMTLYSQASTIDPKSYDACHEWGLSNFRATNEARGKGRRVSIGLGATFTPRTAGNNLPLDVIRPYIINAIKGLLKAVSLGTKKSSASVMQDMLCVLQIWFTYGELPDVAAVLEAGVNSVHLDNWLGVLPQLIARIHHTGELARDLLHSLLSRLGTLHPQALMYPLSVALQSPREDRKHAAERLLDSLRKHNIKLLDQSLMVSQELIRVAILWEELWHEHLEDASRLYFGEGNIDGMLQLLLPLHEKMQQGAATQKEQMFLQTYGAELSEAHECLKGYTRHMQQYGKPIPKSGAAPGVNKSRVGMGQDEVFLAQAWDLYFNVFKRINATLPNIVALDLVHVSPNLVSAIDMDLGVPGTYSVSGHAVRIAKFQPVVSVIRSKQRPRKMRILGQDGAEYVFLLKVC